jgi:DNA modification methylase
MGSGAVGIAAKRCRRKFIGIELDETYYNITKERIETAVRGAGEKRDLISFMKD